MDKRRIKKLNKFDYEKGPVVYWMSRDQRADDNWALLFAAEMAQEKNQPLIVVFCLLPKFLGATMRQYGFMLKGLEEVENSLAKKNIPFKVLSGVPGREIPKFIKQYKVGALITDFDPLRIKRKWKNEVKQKIKIPFYEVDARNIVPVWVASPKQEFAAYTLRPKIKKLLPEFLKEFPALKKFSKNKFKFKNNWNQLRKSLRVNRSVAEVSWLLPGESEAKKVLSKFLRTKLRNYPKFRNDPTESYLSNLSPYLHFGQISAERVALQVKKSKAPRGAKEDFLEELIVRRELSDNFCFYNKNYDKFSGFPDWAKKTLDKHKKDKREYIYSLKDLEKAKTHDDLWNAAQMEMVRRGKMHSYMRMYWAKKILEWTRVPKTALRYAIYLNDKYELDGRDPNGYVGAAWSIGGVHDRAWGERPIFGKIRYMSYNGAKSKFNINEYINNNLKIYAKQKKQEKKKDNRN